MTTKEIAAAVAAHTDKLRPGPGVTEADFHAVRSALADSLKGGQAPHEVIGLPAQPQEPNAEITGAAKGRKSKTNPVRIARRDKPLSVLSRPDWAAGAAPAQTIGPFLDENSGPVWFDVFQLVPQPVQVFRGGVAAFILPSGSKPNSEGISLLLPAGSVWIPTNQLTSDSPPNSWSGIRIKSGTLAYPRGSLFLDGTLSVAVGAELRLQVVPDSVPVPGPADGPGIAATNSDAELPAESTFVFGPLGVESIATAPARLALADGVFDLQRNNAACAYYAPLRQLLIPMTPEPAQYEANSLGSAIFALQGSAPVTSAAWALPTSINAAPANLGEAATGSLVLQIATGLQATWVTLQGNAAPAGHAVLAVNSQSLTFIAKAAVNYRGSHRLQLWRESASANSIVEATFPKPFQLLFISDRSGLDAVGTEALLSARLDRPVRADSARFPVDITGTLLFTQQGTGTMVGIEAIPPQPPSRPIQPIALTNALISVTPPVRMFLRGTLGEGSQVTDGNLLIESLIYQILPTLPDPYAADFTVSPEHDAPRQDCRLAFNVQWPDQDHPKLTINLTLPDGAAPQLFPRPVRDGVDPLLDRIGNRRPPPRAVYWMLDVSSAADQLGVSLDFLLNQPQPQQLAVADVSLEVSGVRLHTLMLPQFQWEPVQNTFNKDTGDIDKLLISNDDGGPSFIKTESVRLVPIAPAPVVAELVRAYNDDRAASHVRFTLPFGIQAFAALQAPDFRYLAPPGLKLLAAPFEDLTGARQISLTSGVTLGPQAGILPDLQPLLLGSATQTNNFAGTAPPGSTLGQLQPDFNASFNTTVPISRIDLSGYGASLFSRWVDPSNPDVGITQVGFDAFNGRTAFERVMMVSFLWPCLARVVRTIVLERQGSGTVLRWDSGWIATTPGLFTHPKFAGIHKGVVEGMHDVREIRDTDQIVTVGSGVNTTALQAVYYDADIAFKPAGPKPPVRAGQNKDGRVPARRQLGFIQRLALPPVAFPAPPLGAADKQAKLLTPALFDELLSKTGPLGGSIDCILGIGTSDQTMRVTGVSTARSGKQSPAAAPEFAVAANGSPIFLAVGRWSVVRVDNAEQSVRTIDAQLGIPLVQRDGGPYRWADPQDLLHDASAASDYALLMAHDAQRFLMQRPKIEVNSLNISSVLPPKVADPYTMLTSQGLFPRVDRAINLPVGTELVASALKLAGDRLDLPAGTLGLIDTKLVNLSAWSDTANFAKAALSIDSLDDWNIRVRQVRQSLEFVGLSDLMTLVHDFESRAGTASQLLDPKIVFAPILQEVADVLQELSRLAPNIPGGVGPFKFSPSFSGTTFSLSATADFKLASGEDDAVECGMGKAKGDLQVGASLSADLLKHDIHGEVFLQIQASWQQEIFPLLYAGGHARFSIRADQDGKTTLELDACTMGSIGGSVIPGLIEIEATVKYGYFIQVRDGKIHPGLVASMEGRAKLLSGLVGFRFSVEGRVLIYPKFDAVTLDRSHVDLYGRIRVAGTITVAWLIDESKSYETDFEQRLNWKSVLFAVKAGLVPVP